MRIAFALLALMFAIAHFFGTFMLAFITGTTASSNQPMMFVLNILTFPLWLLPTSDDSLFSGLVGWLLWITLSLLWGLGLSAVIWAVVARLGRAS